MAANSILLDFSIDSTRITDELSRKDVVKVIKENLEKYFESLKIIYDMVVESDGYLCILVSQTHPGVIINLRFFKEGLITLNIEYFRKEGESQKISFDVSSNFYINIYFQHLYIYISFLTHSTLVQLHQLSSQS